MDDFDLAASVNVDTNVDDSWRVERRVVELDILAKQMFVSYATCHSTSLTQYLNKGM